MRSAVIVSTARTPTGRPGGSAFNDARSQVFGSHALTHQMRRAGIDVGGGTGAAGPFEVA